MYKTRLLLWILASTLFGVSRGCRTAAQSVSVISDRPDTPFKLATFEAGGMVRVGLVLGGRVLDISGASDHLVSEAGVSAMTLPDDMKTLIEEYDTVSPWLYQIANYYGANGSGGLAFAFDVSSVSIKAPIKYPWNVLAAAANYKARRSFPSGISTNCSAPRPHRCRSRPCTTHSPMVRSMRSIWI